MRSKCRMLPCGPFGKPSNTGLTVANGSSLPATTSTGIWRIVVAEILWKGCSRSYLGITRRAQSKESSSWPQMRRNW